MSKVDFYVLSEPGVQSRHRFACRLAEKAYRLEHAVHILAPDEQTLRQLDELLWTFRDGSFVPHDIAGPDGGGTPAPVTIGIDCEPGRPCELLINLGDSLPEGADAFPRVAEIVTADPQAKAASRQRFVDYRDRGHTLDTHMM